MLLSLMWQSHSMDLELPVTNCCYGNCAHCWLPLKPDFVSTSWMNAGAIVIRAPTVWTWNWQSRAVATAMVTICWQYRQVWMVLEIKHCKCLLILFRSVLLVNLKPASPLYGLGTNDHKLLPWQLCALLAAMDYVRLALKSAFVGISAVWIGDCTTNLLSLVCGLTSIAAQSVSQSHLLPVSSGSCWVV